jgi:hypothetical protein
MTVAEQACQHASRPSRCAYCAGISWKAEQERARDRRVDDELLRLGELP